MKYLYSAGDSFVNGDELLDSIADTHPLLNIATIFDIETISKLCNSNPDRYMKITALKDSMTFVGQAAAKFNAEHINYAQSGASIDNISLQVSLILNDIRSKQRAIEDCYIIVGLTSFLRKPYFNLSALLDKEMNTDELLRATDGAIFISQPKTSVWEKHELAISYGKHLSIDQLLLEFCMRVASIDHMLTVAGVKFKIVNVWNDNFLSLSNNQVMSKLCIWVIGDTVNKMWPTWPMSLTSITRGLAPPTLPNGHPTVETHATWGIKLAEQIKLEEGFT